MVIDIQIPGLQAFASRMGLAPKQLEQAERIAVRRAITTMRARARRHAATIGAPPYDQRLPNSIQMETVGSGLVGIVASKAKSALSIEKGRQRGEHVRVGLILGWINRSGIVAEAAAAAGARQSVKSHAVVNRKKRGVAAAQRHLAWKIAMAIAEHGTRPLPFLTPVVGESRVDIRRYFQEAIQYVLRKAAK